MSTPEVVIPEFNTIIVQHGVVDGIPTVCSVDSTGFFSRSHPQSISHEAVVKHVLDTVWKHHESTPVMFHEVIVEDNSVGLGRRSFMQGSPVKHCVTMMPDTCTANNAHRAASVALRDYMYGEGCEGDVALAMMHPVMPKGTAKSTTVLYTDASVRSWGDFRVATYALASKNYREAVFCGAGEDALNIGEAEFLAVCHAASIAPRNSVILSDCEYAVERWNKERAQFHQRVVVRWVKGHADNLGNRAADRLARGYANVVKKASLGDCADENAWRSSLVGYRCETNNAHQQACSGGFFQAKNLTSVCE